MPDRFDRGFDRLRGARTPDLWDRIESREPARPPAEPGPVRRALIATLALVVAVAGLSVGYLAFRGDGSTAGTAGTDVPAPSASATDALPGWVGYQDPAHTFSVQYPEDWHRSEEPLTPDLVDPFEILALGTFELRPGGPNCAQLPVQALTDLGPDDALIWLAERERGDISSYPARPAVFGPTSGTDTDESPDCLAEPKRFFHRWIAFQDGGRGFYALVAMGTDVSDQRRDDTWAILNALTIEPAEAG